MCLHLSGLVAYGRYLCDLLTNRKSLSLISWTTFLTVSSAVSYLVLSVIPVIVISFLLLTVLIGFRILSYFRSSCAFLFLNYHFFYLWSWKLTSNSFIFFLSWSYSWYLWSIFPSNTSIWCVILCRMVYFISVNISVIISLMIVLIDPSPFITTFSSFVFTVLTESSNFSSFELILFILWIKLGISDCLMICCWLSSSPFCSSSFVYLMQYCFLAQ